MYTVMVVDDEKYVRKSIVNRIDWTSLDLMVVAEADNGRSACEVFAEVNPDIVLVDIKMPVMNGLEFLRAVKDSFEGKHFIILSGYDDFDYTKEAIKLKAANYIKKPIDERELTETLRELAEKLREQAADNQRMNELSRKAGLADTMRCDTYLDRLFESLPLLPGDEGVRFQYACFAVILLYMRDLPTGNDMVDRLKQISGSAAAHACRGVDCHIFASRRCRNELRVLVNAAELTPAKIADIASCLRETACGSSQILPEACFASASPSCGNVADIGRMYGKALKRLKQAVCRPGPLFLQDESASSPDDAAAQSFLDYLGGMVNTLKDDLEKNDVKAAGRLLDSLFDKRNEAFFTVAVLETVVREIGSAMEHIALRMNLPAQEFSRFDLYQPYYLLKFRNVSELRLDLERLIGEIFRFLTNEEISLIEKIKRYVALRYEDDLSLPAIAREFYVNPSYLSQVFKAKTGENLSDFIETVRIERAKEILSRFCMTVTQAAQHVGYNDSNYFSKVFKKRTGTLPSQYQELNKTNKMN